MAFITQKSLIPRQKKVIRVKSTGQRDHEESVNVAMTWKRKGIPQGHTRITRKSPASMNNIIKAGTVAFKWAAQNILIKENLTEGITMFSGKSKKRGIITDKDDLKLFEIGIWTGRSANKKGNWTAAQTGLRAGEIIGL